MLEEIMCTLLYSPPRLFVPVHERAGNGECKKARVAIRNDVEYTHIFMHRENTQCKNITQGFLNPTYLVLKRIRTTTGGNPSSVSRREDGS